MNKLLTRDEFREGVFKRDNHQCVICKEPAKDAHHIMERRLFHDGGYYLDNGASLCHAHHLQAEMTLISTNELREAIGIQKVILPEQLYDDQEYDKWGNVLQQNGTRLKGELFFDESVQKILEQGNVLDIFTDKVKYPRTHHLPWSEQVNIDVKITSSGSSFCPDPDQSFIESNSDYFKQLKAIKDERVLHSTKVFEDKRVIVSTKMDGENTTLYHDYTHVRSLDSQNHESRNWVKNFWSQIAHDIPIGWRICGENMFATHSIKYENLKTYFYGFSIWNEKNECLSWDDTLFWFELLGITPVPVLYDGIYDEEKIRQIWCTLDSTYNEGYVLRIADQFSYFEFKKCVGKFVRKNHIQTVKHWMYGQKMEVNSLKDK